MPTKTIDLYSANKARPVLAHKVYAKLNWGDAWEEKTGVFCTNATWACAPNFPEATLHYRYGLGRLNENSATTLWNEIDLPTLAYVKIVFRARKLDVDETEEDMIWVGVAGRLVDEVFGRGDTPGSPAPTGPLDIVQQPVDAGIQNINCVGLEWILQQHTIHDSWMDGWTSATHLVDRLKRVTTALVFGINKTTTKVVMPLATQPDVYVFNNGNRSLAQSTTWTIADALNHLLTFQVPRVSNDLADAAAWATVWTLDDTAGVIPADEATGLNVDGETMWSVVSRLVPRQRARGWYVGLNSTEDVIQIKTFSYLATALTLPDATTIPANLNKYDLAVNQDYGSSLSVSTDAFAKFDRVVARGGPLVTMWTSELKRETGETTPTVPSISGLLFAAARMVKRTAQWLGLDAGRLTRFTVGPAIRSAAAGAPHMDAIEAADGIPTPPLTQPSVLSCPAWNMRILSTIPVGREATYDGTTVPASAADLDIRDGIPPQVWIQPYLYEDGDYRQSSALANLNIINGAAATQGAVSPIRRVGGPYAIIPTDRPNGEYEITSGGAHFATAFPSLSFTAAPTSDEQEFTVWTHSSTVTTVLTKRSTIAAVYVTLASDFGGQRIEVTATAAGTPPTDLIRTKVIDCGNKFQLHMAAKNTIIDAQAHATISGQRKPVLQGEVDILRDDREALRKAAEMALEWYSQDRRAVSFSTSFLTSDIQIGHLVTKILSGSREITVNSVVTSISLSQEINTGMQRVSYELAHAEMDLYP
jgi:hypothetical protein